MEATSLSPAHALRRPRRLDARAVFGILLLLTASGGGVIFWGVSSNTRAVLVATRDLPAGATLMAADLSVTRVRVDDALYNAAVPAADLNTFTGKRLAEPVHAEQMLTRAQLSTYLSPGLNQVAMTVAVSPDTAVGGRIHPGDAVQVLLTADKGKLESRTTVLLSRVMVLDVGHDPRVTTLSTDRADASAADGPIHWLTLIMTPDQAIQLAQAKWNGELDMVLLPPG